MQHGREKTSPQSHQNAHNSWWWGKPDKAGYEQKDKSMKTLTHKATKGLVKQMHSLAVCGQSELWIKWANEQGDKPAIVEFPCGELFNESIAGFLWAWKMKGIIETCAIEKKDRFNANGLEGKVKVTTTLTVALLVWRDLPEHRCQVRM